jgi:hypothetical protein
MAKCTGFPHAYDPETCPLDRQQYLREGNRQETTQPQREKMRAALHAGQAGKALDQLEDDLDRK